MKTLENKQQLATEVLIHCRNSLLSGFPFLDGAFASLAFAPSEDSDTMGSDGEHLLFCPSYVLSEFSADPNALRRACLHTLLHWLYLHPFMRGSRDAGLWNLACDMAVEQILRKEDCDTICIFSDPVKERCLELLGNTPRTAQQIYEMLENQLFSDPLPVLKKAFSADDHRLWPQPTPELSEKWEYLLDYTSSQNGKGTKRAGSSPGKEEEKLEEIPKGVGDYRSYLKRFAVSGEEMELDMDSFDYIYYHLGMERYGNLPLMEPLEYREGHKLQQLVIAIDTSGSCDRETVRNFLGETYGILSDQENFFRKMEVYLIQCDCLIQSVQVIHSYEQWKHYSREILISGRGGTDFTPVFRYVDGLREQGKLRNLKGLLYFTDGDGYFPREKPDYETAFVFLKPNEFMNAVPAWAEKLLVSNR